ncbi:MAG: hypothetical protein LBH19_15340 [Dysgonamonadaceae bacterium]|jgi:hypothetical protein|nr:hypothetical protein [Dysgonamonadaceae bacterium]
MKYARFSAAILLAIMVLNICKYQMPYIEYSLFKNYIAENVCVKKNEPNNCCKGKCYLEKQIQAVSETENDLNIPVEKKQISSDTSDYIRINAFFQAQNPAVTIPLPRWIVSGFTNIILDIPVPPPQRFISFC